MSFSQEIRSTGNFNSIFQKEKRRLQLSEVPKSDIDTLQEHVVDIRHQVHFTELIHDQINIKDVPTGPNDYYFEPDYSTVKIRDKFMDVYGIGTYANKTINSLSFDSLQLFDQAATGCQHWFCIPHATNETFNANDSLLWDWQPGFIPKPNMPQGNSISLNIPSNTKQFYYIDNIGTTNFDFTATNFSLGFWIYPTDVSNTGSPRAVAYRFIDSNNKWVVSIDTDGILFVTFKVGGVVTRRQYSTPLTANSWYFVCFTWTSGGPTLVLKVNNNADAASVKTETTTNTATNLFFGSYAGATVAEDFKGYLTGITYYRSTVLSAGEMTSLYTYNTKSAITEPFTWGYGQYG